MESKRISISTGKDDKGKLLLNVDGTDSEIIFRFASMTDYKKSIDLAVKAKEKLEQIKVMKSDPIKIFDIYEAASADYLNVLEIALGNEALVEFSKLTRIPLPMAALQAVIVQVARLYAEHFKAQTEAFLNTEGKL